RRGRRDVRRDELVVEAELGDVREPLGAQGPLGGAGARERLLEHLLERSLEVAAARARARLNREAPGADTEQAAQRDAACRRSTVGAGPGGGDEPTTPALRLPQQH